MDRQANMLNSETDISSLVRQSQAGSRDAFNCLVKCYQACAMKAAVRVLTDVDEASEAVQDGFVAAYLKIKKLKDPAKFGPWLLRIVVNNAIDYRTSAIQRRHLLRIMQARSHPVSEDPKDSMGEDELQAAIKLAMGKLTKIQARAIALFGIEELSHKEVAEILGCSPQAARWHVYKARKKLTVLLKDYIQ